ncbi:hypothetical protein MTR67_007765 [Solanum verrucosum]|uniref:Uncharacterized protein n=1 Tax=Solanum verrucosum TaxID=315347 RepID=A0AAF0TIJ1_SOLVR|nr:hypothetical protein MTR67_007765 [Solanum verrucosum]
MTIRQGDCDTLDDEGRFSQRSSHDTLERDALRVDSLDRWAGFLGCSLFSGFASAEKKKRGRVTLGRQQSPNIYAFNSNFERSSFLYNVRDFSESTDGLIDIQSVEDGINQIKSDIYSKWVLVVLDDVDEVDCYHRNARLLLFRKTRLSRQNDQSRQPQPRKVSLYGSSIESNGKSKKVDSVNTDAFFGMDKLRLLQLDNLTVKGNYKEFPKSLRWLCWHKFPYKCLPDGLPMEKLVALEMSYTSQCIKDSESESFRSDLIPVELGDFSTLQNLFLSKNPIHSLPDSIKGLTSLQGLYEFGIFSTSVHGSELVKLQC